MRLTMRSGGTAYWKTGENAGYRPDDVCFRSEVERLDKLAAYEDTGYSPIEIKSLEGEWNAMRKVVDSYRKAEEQGLLVRLPCKIGSTLYVLRGDVSNGWETLKPTHIETVKFTLGCLDKDLNLYPCYYLTREEAEAALEGGQNDA